MAARAPSPYPRLAAEFLSAFLLTFAVLASLGLNVGFPTPVIAALTIMVLVYLFGPISGTHANPAVTIGQLTIGNISPYMSVGYICVQVVGALGAMLLFGQMASPAIPQPGPLLFGVIGEALGAFVLAFGVARVTLGKVAADASGLTVGLSLLLGITVASVGALGVINPAVALALNIFEPGTMPGLWINLAVYVAAPILGAILGSLLAQWFSQGGK